MGGEPGRSVSGTETESGRDEETNGAAQEGKSCLERWPSLCQAGEQEPNKYFDVSLPMPDTCTSSLPLRCPARTSTPLFHSSLH